MYRNFGLDLLRAISIWLVLLQHGGVNITGLQPLRIGGIGVELFFVMSGFLIGGIIFKEIDKGNTIAQTLKVFWIRRWFRILPLYYLVLLFKFIFIDDTVGWNILYYFAFLQNNFYGTSFLAISWSLVIEEWFYLFAPVVLIFSQRILKKNSSTLLVLFLLVIVVNILRFAYVYRSNAPYDGINGNFVFRFDSLFLGVIIVFLKHTKNSVYKKLESKFVFFSALLLLIGYVYYYWSLAYPNNLVDQKIFPRTLGFFILPFSLGLILPFVATAKINTTNIISKMSYIAITRTSLLTYAIYLIHPFVFALIHKENALFASHTIQLAVAILITYLLAGITYTYFERPILNYRDRITNKKEFTRTMEKATALKVF